jgi:hypothetical protein
VRTGVRLEHQRAVAGSDGARRRQKQHQREASSRRQAS